MIQLEPQYFYGLTISLKKPKGIIIPYVYEVLLGVITNVILF